MEKPKRRPFQFSLGALLFLVAACAVVFGVARWRYFEQLARVRDSHAAIGIAAMINTYMDANEGRWPASWDDLRPFYKINGIVTGTDYCTFEEIRESWDVDFEADPAELARVEHTPGVAPFHAITQRHARPMSHPEWEPNVRVYHHLRGYAGLQTAAMIIEYLKANDDAWPDDWEDLRRVYPAAVKPNGNHYCSFELARGCMEIDFEADPVELAKARPQPGELPFRVVSPVDDEARPGGWEPNQRIFEYLTSRSTAGEPQPPDAPRTFVAPKTPIAPGTSVAMADRVHNRLTAIDHRPLSTIDRYRPLTSIVH